MKTTTTVIACAIFLTGVSMTQNPSFADSTCDENSDTHKLVIIVTNNRPTKVVHAGANGGDADVITVCIGDQVEWHIVGSASDYYIDFPGGAPYEGATRKNSNANGKILATIGGPAKEGGDYKYDIGIVDGGVLDPRIIIAR
ncbi:MAG: hypothetical protein IIA07_02765 [Proteobacteria bacterium]|nr:hypothetical protein [Pseudomonadota bacterium]